jgi:hypothetical protein
MTILRKAGAVLAAALWLGFAAPASADVVERQQVGPWHLEAYYEGGEFQNCRILASYGGGAQVIFLLTRDVAWVMGIQNPSWNLVPGNKGRVDYWVDGLGRRSAVATARNQTLLAVPLADSRQLFEEIRWGNVLYFTVDGAPYNMTLRGTAVALDALMNCVRRHR